MIENDLTLLHALAEAAETAILPHFRLLPGVDNKDAAGFDPVTVADRAAEEAIRAILSSERPGDAIYGEEFPRTAGTSGRTWILDPIDGTRPFMLGLPVWGVLIALADAQGPAMGMMAQPVVGERFWGTREGAFHRGRDGEIRLATRACETIGQAIVATTSHRNFPPGLRERFEALGDAARMVRYGTDCYAYALLAAGHIDVVVETDLKPFDIAPFVPIVEAAGGVLTDFAGNRIGPTLPDGYGGQAVAVGDPRLLPGVLERLSG